MTTETSILQILWCWQAVALACIVSSLTGVVKKSIDYGTGEKDWHKKRRWTKAVVLPLIPLALGAVLAIVLPLRSTYLYEYIELLHAKHVRVRTWVVYGSWGATIGVLADYIYQRFVKLLQKE